MVMAWEATFAGVPGFLPGLKSLELKAGIGRAKARPYQIASGSLISLKRFVDEGSED
jgi:hypothetical protein